MRCYSFLYIVVIAWLCQAVLAANHFTISAVKGGISSVDLNSTYSESTTIYPFGNAGPITGLCISGSVTKQADDYLIRVILKDKDGHEYCVMELYNAINDQTVFTVTDYCEETAILNNIVPECLKLIIHNATLNLVNVVVAESTDRSLLNFDYKERSSAVKKAQTDDIIEKINTHNVAKGIPWVAGESALSLLSYEDKRRLLGFPDNISTGGYEYYYDGFFIVGNIGSKSRNETESDYVSSFDWRDRHGKSWVTSVKDQKHSNFCFAFSSTACLESMYMLYYNDTTNIDLSDAEAALCTNQGDSVFKKGGYVRNVMDYFHDHGLHDESLNKYVFQDSEYQTCMTDEGDTNELVHVEGYDSLNNVVLDDSIKHWIINYGPLVSGYWWMNPINFSRIGGHSMLLVGYGVVSQGDIIRLHHYYGLGSPASANSDYVGRTYWIFKNSYGGIDDAYLGGYQHIVFVDEPFRYGSYPHNAFMNKVYRLKYPILSNMKTEQDIICEDADGDGFYYWGIGDEKPSSCPSWAPDVPDGDDHDINLGPMDIYGHLEELHCGVTIKIPTLYLTNNTLSCNLGIVRGGSLTISGTTTLSGDSKVRVCEGGTLIVDGGSLQNADLVLVPGSTLILRNGGSIKMASGKVFNAPVGAVVNIESGEID